jgi:hypothetical protein
MTNLECAKATNAALFDSIKFADSKAGVILSAVTMAGTACAFSVHPVVSALSGRGMWLVCPFWIAGAVVIAAVVIASAFCISVLAPQRPQANGAITSYPDILALGSQAYINALRGATETMLIEHFGQHNFVLAQIVSNKFDAIGKAVTCIYVVAGGSYVILALYAATAIF